MNIIKFIDRLNELRYLEESRKLSEKKLFSLSIYGLRRVGKTRLILESMGEDDLYFFVNKYKSSESLLKEYEGSLKARGILTEMESLRSWEDFFKALFGRFKGIIVFDEFQNFAHVDRSVLGIIQKHFDMNENTDGMLFIFSGSTTGMIKKMFSDSKEPLHGRLKRSLHLKPMAFRDIIAMCVEAGIIDIRDIVSLYCILGGFPKYYVAIEDESMGGSGIMEILDKFFLQENAVLEEEVSSIISLEFGKRMGTYYDILAAVANGCTRISEIASFMGKKETALTRQINELMNYFGFLGFEKQAVGKKRALFINHPLINFWFRFFFRDISAYKKREDWFIEGVKREINSYIGRRFEYVCREFLEEAKDILPFAYEKIGRQWGRIPGAEKGRNAYEMDIVAVSEQTREILFAECKWQDKVNPEKILGELREKAKMVDWNVGKRKEHYAIFAKSFGSRNAGDVMLFDLKDMEKVFRKNQSA